MTLSSGHNLQDNIKLLTTDQREWIEFYTEPVRGDELPIGTSIRIIDEQMAWCYGKTGHIEAYHQPARGWAEWYYVRFDDTDELAKIHREKFEVIE